MRSASPSETVRQTKLVRRADPSRPYDWFGERSTIQHSDEFFAAKDEHLLSRLAMVIDESQLFTVTLARSTSVRVRRARLALHQDCRPGVHGPLVHGTGPLNACDDLRPKLAENAGYCDVLTPERNQASMALHAGKVVRGLSEPRGPFPTPSARGWLTRWASSSCQQAVFEYHVVR